MEFINKIEFSTQIDSTGCCTFILNSTRKKNQIVPSSKKKLTVQNHGPVWCLFFFLNSKQNYQGPIENNDMKMMERKGKHGYSNQQNKKKKA